MDLNQQMNELAAEHRRLSAEEHRLAAALEVVERQKYAVKQRLIRLQDQLDNQQHDAIEVPANALTGADLLAMIKRLGDVSKSTLVRACGYVSERDGGGERLEFSSFYEALLEAKNVRLY